MDTRPHGEYRVKKNRRRRRGRWRQTEATEQNSGAQNESQGAPGDAAPRDESSRDNPLAANSAQDDASHGSAPRDTTHRRHVQTYGLLRILPKLEIRTSPSFLVRNPDEDGPQTDICARVPSRPGTWVARVSCTQSNYQLWDLMGELEPEFEQGSITRFFIPVASQTYTIDQSSTDGHVTLVPSKDISVNILATPVYPGYTMDDIRGTPNRDYEAKFRELLGEEGSKWLV
ncbi:hypothetical protein IL306_014418 [Fusarium sp. DS 682]|nr:hypothetical protein IL306_014418 [Fusarium sp. DS 682]